MKRIVVLTTLSHECHVWEMDNQEEVEDWLSSVHQTGFAEIPRSETSLLSLTYLPITQIKEIRVQDKLGATEADA